MDIKDINFAIDILSHPQSGDASDIKEAFKIAIESLKAWKESLGQEPCEDAINRILKRMWNCRGKHTTSIDKVKMEQIIRDEFPPVTSQPKTGHWISCGNVYCGDVYMCSECDYVGVDYDNYCSNCGARMEKGE